MKEWFQKFLKLFENEVTADIKERVTNPFFVSLTISWLVWNWRLVFIFLNFNEEDPLNEKLWRIKIHLSETSSLNLYLWPILTALFAVLVLGMMNQVSLAISVLFRRRIRPVIFKKIGYKDIVDLETHNKIKNRLYNLQEAYTTLESRNSDSSDVTTTLRKERDAERDEKLKAQNDLFELKNNNNTKHNLEGLFEGTWRCDYILIDGRTGDESVEIQEGNKYIKDGRYTFNLDMIEVNENTIKYRKVDIDDDRRTATGVLKIINENEYRGIEDRNTMISYKKYSSDVMELKFTPTYEPHEIQATGKSKIIFKIKNSTNRDLEVLSYQFYCIFDRNRYGEYPKHTFKKEISASNEVNEIFNEVDPLKVYFNDETKSGVYDSEIHLEYRFLGTTDVKRCVSFARLIVTDGVVVHSATFGIGNKTNDAAEIIKRLVSKNQFVIEVSTILFGDPVPGVQKTLVVNYAINGVRKNASQVEGKKLKLE